MPDWEELNSATTAAIRSGDLPRAEELLAKTWRAARRQGDRELECNTLFTEGMLRDKQERLAEAEDAFLRALAIDRELHGPDHIAVADTLNSIGIVRTRRGDREGALAAYADAAGVIEKAQPSALAAALNTVAKAELALERFDDVLETCEDARAAWLLDERSPHHHLRESHLIAGEAYRRSKRFPPALGQFAIATRTRGAALRHELGDTVARAWFSTGFVSRYCLQDCAVLAAIAFWYATRLPSAEMAARAKRELETLAERTVAEGDPRSWRLVYRHGRDVNVASLAWGLYHARLDVDAEVGDVVDVTLEDEAIVAIS